MNPAFRYRHWAGFSDNTHPFGLAVAFVFVKQSVPPSHCDLLLRRAGTPSPEVAGLICRIPSPRLRRHALGSSPRTPESVLGTNTESLALQSLSLTPGICQSPLMGTHSCLHPVPSITELPGLKHLDGATTPFSIPRCNDEAKILWCRNINLLPFRHARLRHALGSTHPRLSEIAEEPVSFRRSGFSPLFAATLARILVSTQSIGAHAPTSHHALRPPTGSPLGALKYRYLA